MKKLILILIFLFTYQFNYAQSPVLDKEKLLDFYESQRYAEAAQYLQSVYPADTKDIKALSQIAYCNMMAGKLPEAEKNYLKINELQPNTLPILFNLASINSRRGNTAKAKAYLKTITKVDTNNFRAFKQLASLITDSVELELQYLMKANKLNPEDADVAFDLAKAFKEMKMYLPAYNVLKTAIAADTSNLSLLQAQLPIANELKKYTEVVTVGEKLMQNEANANVLRDVGKAYFNLKNYQKCISLYRLLEDMSMQNESMLYYLSLSYRELKNYEMATKYAKKTIEEGISTNTTAYYLLLGGIYEMNNQLTSTLAAYKKGLTFGPNRTIYYRLGLLYDLKLNQKKNAMSYYNLYLKSKPEIEEKAQIDYVKTRIIAINQPKVLQK